MSRSEQMREEERMEEAEERERWEREDLDYEGWRIMQENHSARRDDSSSSGGCLSALILLPVFPVMNLFRNLFI